MSSRQQQVVFEKIEKGDFYDAQQMAKTVYRRLSGKGEADKAEAFCVQACHSFCQAGHFELAVDLGKDVVSGYEDRKAEVSEGNLKVIEMIIAEIPPGNVYDQTNTLLSRALKWSTAVVPQGHPQLHRLAGEFYKANGNFGKCHAHMVYCQDGVALAAMVAQWLTRGYPNEKEMFLLRTLLILLGLQDLSTARSFWEASVPTGCAPSGKLPESGQGSGEAEHQATSSVSCPPAELPPPPVQCGSLLLAATEAGDVSFFRAVRNKYMLVLARDSTFSKYCDQVEANVFGAQPQQDGLGALFDMLLGGGSRGPVAAAPVPPAPAANAGVGVLTGSGGGTT